MTLAVADHADHLLAVALPRLGDAAKNAHDARRGALDDAVGYLESARGALDRAADLDVEERWIVDVAEAALDERGRVVPFRAGGRPSDATNLIGQVLRTLAAEDEHRRDAADWNRRMREADEQLPAPPTRADLEAELPHHDDDGEVAW